MPDALAQRGMGLDMAVACTRQSRLISYSAIESFRLLNIRLCDPYRKTRLPAVYMQATFYVSP